MNCLLWFWILNCLLWFFVFVVSGKWNCVQWRRTIFCMRKDFHGLISAREKKICGSLSQENKKIRNKEIFCFFADFIIFLRHILQIAINNPVCIFDCIIHALRHTSYIYTHGRFRAVSWCCFRFGFTLCYESAWMVFWKSDILEAQCQQAWLLSSSRLNHVFFQMIVQSISPLIKQSLSNSI